MQLESLTLMDDIVQLKLRGRLDRMGTETINDRFSLAATVRKGKYIVDLAEVSFLTSAGIRMLMMTAKAQQNRGGMVVLAAPQPLILQVIEASGIDQLIEVAADIESAVSRLKSAA